MFGFHPQDRTDITVVLDRSGSMASIAEKTVEGFGAFLEKQKSVPGDCRLTLVQFDTQYELVYYDKPLRKVPPLRLVPRGATALLDAMGRTILNKVESLGRMSVERLPRRIMMVVITDGQENSSREFTREQVFSLTQRYTQEFDWQFVYLGANQDAIQVAAQMGIDAAAAMNYQAGRRGTFNAWEAAASLVGRNAASHRRRCARAASPWGNDNRPRKRIERPAATEISLFPFRAHSCQIWTVSRKLQHF